MDELAFFGIVKTIFFSNPDNFYKVMLVEITDEDFDFSSDEITVTGIFGDISEGEKYKFIGKLTTHYKYGEQFQCTNYEHQKPDTRESLINYFASDKFKGIGKKTAENIVDTIGLDVIEKINKDASVLEEVPHLNVKKRDLIATVVNDNYGMEQIIIKLNALGFSNNTSFQIYQTYKSDAYEKVSENPYDLILEIQHLGFQTIDKIAQNLEIKHDDANRIQAGILETITKHCYMTGDTYLSVDDLLQKTKILLDSNRLEEVSFDLIADQVVALLEKRRLSRQDKKIYIDFLNASEESIAENIIRLTERKNNSYSTKKIEKALKNVEQDIGITYDKTQKEAIMSAIKSAFFVITGGPGTGKTTIINGIVKVYAKLNDYSLDVRDYDSSEDFPIKLAAPTGRAAKRMSETTKIPAVTIHRLLGLGKENDGELAYADKEFDTGLLIVDEFSMVDTQLASRLLEAVSGDMQVIFVGDKDQLPSVGPGQVLTDLLNIESINSCFLSKIYRQSDDSSIIELAHDVSEGNYTDDFTKNYADRSYFHSDVNNIEPMVKKIVESAKSKGYTARDVQVLAPMYRGAAGIDKLNQMMQELFNPKEKNSLEFSHSKGVYRLGDKVLYLVNSPEDNVFNGDIGNIVGMIPASNAESEMDELIIDFSEEEIILPRSNWNDITLAYCCSIHKSQGSEFPVVILPMVSGYAKQLLKRNLLYTAITRSKDKLIMLGEENIFKYCIEHSADIRKTGLSDRFKRILGSDSEEVQEKITEKEYILTNDLIVQNKIPVFIGMDEVTPYDFMNKEK